jgi:hypothetical protein
MQAKRGCLGQQKTTYYIIMITYIKRGLLESQTKENLHPNKEHDGGTHISGLSIVSIKINYDTNKTIHKLTVFREKAEILSTIVDDVILKISTLWFKCLCINTKSNSLKSE